MSSQRKTNRKNRLPPSLEKGRRMAEVQVREGESLESALKRFRREVKKSNIFSELKRKRHYEKPSERRQRKLRSRNRRG